MKSKCPIYFFLIVLMLISCKKEVSKDFNQLKYSKNTTTYSKIKLDSAQAINHIASIKIQELLDLFSLYASGNRDTEIDSVIYKQMQSYFITNDTLSINKITKELDSLKVKTANASILEVIKEVRGIDTLNIARFNVEYFDKNNHKIGLQQKASKFILKKNPTKVSQEFKFYFKDFLQNDSTSVGKTK